MRSGPAACGTALRRRRFQCTQSALDSGRDRKYTCPMQPLSKASGGLAARRVADCAVEVLDGVPPVVWHIRRRMRAQRQGLSIPQFRALFVIRTQPAASLSAVAEHLGSSLPTASRLIGGMESKGLLKRSGCKGDRRQMELVLTRRGNAVLDAARAATLEAMRVEMSGLDDGQRELIIRAIRLLRGVFAPGLAAVGGSGTTRSAASGGGRKKATLAD